MGRTLYRARPDSKLTEGIRPASGESGQKALTGGHRGRPTQGERPWAYDRDSTFGKLDKGLDAASVYQWTVVDMARDWATVFPE